MWAESAPANSREYCARADVRTGLEVRGATFREPLASKPCLSSGFMNYERAKRLENGGS
jgi:hypothetical protein